MAIMFVNIINDDIFETENKKLIEKIMPIIRPLSIADFVILGCIKTFFILRYKSTKKLLQ